MRRCCNSILVQAMLIAASALLGSAGRKPLIDESTKYQSIRRHRDGKKLQLVMSDEFADDGRSFAKGDDDYFEALQKPDDTNEAIQFYNSSTEYVTTKDGMLTIATRAVKTSWINWDENHLRPERLTKNYTSGMVQSWNKFCFTGGVLEVSIELPGHADSGGLWPAFWLMGNLARATFPKSTMDVWPWSYDKCGEIDSLQQKQEVSACDSNSNGRYGMHPYQGRGAPEIDIFEVMPGHEMPGSGAVTAFMSSSLQISPGISKTKNRPKNGHKLNSSFIWYDIEKGDRGEFNDGFWGQECGPEIDNSMGHKHKYMEDALSVNTNLNSSHFEAQHVYRLEWQPGLGGYLSWYLDNELLMHIDSKSIEQLTGAFIPAEPMYLVMNTAISHRWGMPEPCPVSDCPVCWHCYDCTNPDCQCALPSGMKQCKNLPAEMKIDFVRLYQDAEDATHTVSCSPPDFPTAEFIAAHSSRYKDWVPLSEEHEQIYYTLRIAAVIFFSMVFALTFLYIVYKLRLMLCSYCCSNSSNANGYSRIRDSSSSSSGRPSSGSSSGTFDVIYPRTGRMSAQPNDCEMTPLR